MTCKKCFSNKAATVSQDAPAHCMAPNPNVIVP